MRDVRACDLLAERLAARHYADLSSSERAELNAHIASCTACAEEKADYDLLTTGIRQLPAVAPLAATTQAFFWRDSSSSGQTGLRKRTAFSLLPMRTIAISAGALAVATVLVISLVLLQQTRSEIASRTGVVSQNATATVSITANGCPVPAAPDQNIACTASYTGTMTVRESTLSSPLQLTVRQQREKLSGSATLSFPTIPTLPLHVTAHLSGTIDNQGAVHFSIQPAPNLTFSFTGFVHQSAKTISGSYTTNTGQAGTWNVHLMV